VDRPGGWLGLPVPGAEPRLLEYFQVNNIKKVKYTIADDVGGTIYYDLTFA
jgi:hypothetical protein